MNVSCTDLSPAVTRRNKPNWSVSRFSAPKFICGGIPLLCEAIVQTRSFKFLEERKQMKTVSTYNSSKRLRRLSGVGLKK